MRYSRAYLNRSLRWLTAAFWVWESCRPAPSRKRLLEGRN
jgi:hypothetical protein